MRLDESDRAFFQQVARSLYTNPFSQSRFERDAQVVNMPWPTQRAAVIETLLGALNQKLDALRPHTLDAFSSDDGRLILQGVLFWALHRWWHDFEDLLQRQKKATAPVNAAFGQEIIDHLCLWGLERAAAIRFVGIFHQIHRAYTLIGNNLPGQSPSIYALRERLWVNVFSHDLALYVDVLWDRLDEFSTFLVGASGTGKGSAANALGQSGWIPYDAVRGRFEASFTELLVPINLSQFPDTLIESELFGHAKGAFTGAIKAYDGVLSQCQKHSTLFLDEIGEVAEHIQVKLLNVLQERVYSPVGTHQQEPFLGRIVAATNVPFETLREEGRLRDDFYYRLCSDVITVPTLRQRLDEQPDELLMLVRALLSSLLGDVSRYEDLVMSTLNTHIPDRYMWPGNVRELAQRVRQIVLTGQVHDLATTPTRSWWQQAQHEPISLERLNALYCHALYESLGSYQAVAKKVGADRRTVSKYVQMIQQDNV